MASSVGSNIAWLVVPAATWLSIEYRCCNWAASASAWEVGRSEADQLKYIIQGGRGVAGQKGVGDEHSQQ